jgi:hypothetical protein
VILEIGASRAAGHAPDATYWNMRFAPRQAKLHDVTSIAPEQPTLIIAEIPRAGYFKPHPIICCDFRGFREQLK